MDWVAFENDRKFVLERLRRGEVDYVEHVSEAAEADLFRHLVSRDVLTRLAETYPTPRKKEEVPGAKQPSMTFMSGQAAWPDLVCIGGWVCEGSRSRMDDGLDYRPRSNR